MSFGSSGAITGMAIPSQDRQADRELVELARSGDAAAFELIMRRHNRLLFRTARGIAVDDSEAQDVVQETYLRAFTRLDSYRADAALGTWLARIAINVALDTQRARARLIAIDDLQETDEKSMELPMSFSDLRHDDPAAKAERGQLRDLLQSAIERLPPIYRSVFILRAVEDMSVEDSAYCLNVSADVVKTRYLRARALLRDALGAQIEAHATEVFSFAGERCDAVVSHVLAALRKQGQIRPR
ncbi:MAG: RNA polymerase sigma factor [Gemmatimonadota bacterium]